MIERDFWLHVTETADWKTRYIADPTISIDATLDIITATFPDSPQWILEIGCGYGRLTAEMQSRFPASTVSGTDISAAVLAEAAPGPRYHCQDTLHGLPTQDAIYSVTVFQHIPHIEQHAYVHQAHQLLNPGGVLTVQYIDGAHDSFCNHETPTHTMMSWLDDFEAVDVQHGLVHPRWSWITGTK